MVDRPQILVIRGGAIGDFILTLPAIALMRENIPRARIEVLGYKPVIELAVAGGIADEIRNLEHVCMAKFFVPGADLDPEWVAYFRRFNLVLSYLYDPDGIFRGNMERIGVKTYLEAAHRVQPGKGHAAEQLAKPLEKLAMFLSDPAPRLRIPPSSSFVSPHTLAFHPGSGSPNKNWPLEQWVRLIREIRLRRPQVPLALITGEAEAERGTTAEFLRACRGVDIFHWDQLPLTELGAQLTACQGFLGHDSGISHLAAAAGVPCLLLFGPTDPNLWAPRDPAVRVVAAPEQEIHHLGFDTVWSAYADWERMGALS